MPKDPQYIRLAHNRRDGSAHDLRSGFSIGGGDVQRFPEDERAAEFVRKAIRSRRLEAASKAEFELAHGAFANGWSTKETHQESDLRARSAEVTEKLVARRLDDYASPDYSSEEGRKEEPEAFSVGADPASEEDDEDEEKVVYLDDLEVPELRALAKERGVKVPARASKETLVSILEKEQ